MITRSTHGSQSLDRMKRFGIGPAEFVLFRVVESVLLGGALYGGGFTVEYVRQKTGNGAHFRLYEFGQLRGAFETKSGHYIEAARLDLTRFLYLRGIRRDMVTVDNIAPRLITTPGCTKVAKRFTALSVIDYEDPEWIKARYEAAETEGKILLSNVDKRQEHS